MTPTGFSVLSFTLEFLTKLTSVFCLRSYTKATGISGACCRRLHLIQQHLTNSTLGCHKSQQKCNFPLTIREKNKNKKAFSLLQLCREKKKKSSFVNC